MALDAMFVSGLGTELNKELCGAKVDKLYQPERDEIVLSLRGSYFSGRLLISANTNNARVCKLDSARENPPNAPMFCMLLRKHLTGGRIISVSQPGLERILDFEFEVKDELGEKATKTLTVEMLGRHSNIILRDDKNLIVDCLKRVDYDMSKKRQVLPGLIYDLPPKQNKINPLSVGRAEIFRMLCESREEIAAEKWLLDRFFGVSPLICREIVYRAERDATLKISELTDDAKERVAAEADKILNAVSEERFEPCILIDRDRPADYSFIPIYQYENVYKIRFSSGMSDALCTFYQIRDEQDRMKKRSRDILKTVNCAHERANRKLELQKQEITASLNREEIRKHADIITANLYRLDKGMNKLTAVDYFDPENTEIEIKLDISLTPQQNAAKLYKKYNKMKNTEKYASEQIKQSEKEIEYLESVKDSIDRAETFSDITEIREELSDTGYLKRTQLPRKKKSEALNPFRFISSDGYRIYAGRNNKQNDLLTLKTAYKDDLWLHTQKIPGSHVIIECAGKTPPPRTITEAAIICVYHSRARNSNKVPVDYTRVRHVKKMPGGKPGMVTYINQKTAFADSDEGLVKSLRVEE